MNVNVSHKNVSKYYNNFNNFIKIRKVEVKIY